MSRLYRPMIVLLFALSVLAGPGGHSSAMARAARDFGGIAMQTQAAMLSKRCPNAGNMQIPRAGVSCGLDLITTRILSLGHPRRGVLRSAYAIAAELRPSAWAEACPHGPPKPVS